MNHHRQRLMLHQERGSKQSVASFRIERVLLIKVEMRHLGSTLFTFSMCQLRPQGMVDERPDVA